MRRLILAAALVVAGPVMAWADEALAPDPAIEGTIQSQFDAFLADDVGRAFNFASPMIQGMFGSADNFGMMVQNGYPMVWRPGNVRFLELREKGGRLWQKVMIQDQAGGFHVLDYQMVEGADGWRINGVTMLEAPEVGA